MRGWQVECTASHGIFSPRRSSLLQVNYQEGLELQKSVERCNDLREIYVENESAPFSVCCLFVADVTELIMFKRYICI